MTNKALADLTAAGSLGGTELFYVVDSSGNSRKLTLSDLKTFINTDPTSVPSSQPWRGARVSLTANQAFTTGVSAAVSWGTADIDTDTFWSIGAPTRLTVPAGVTKVRLRMQGRWNANSTGVRQLMLTKNGSSSLEGRASTTIGAAASTNHEHGAVSGVLTVTAGDYFEVNGYQTSGGALTLLDAPATWFEIEVVEASL